MILLEHPQHGRHHVYTDDELAKHVALGWRPVGAAPVPQGSASVSYPAVPESAPPKRKRGRPRKVIP